MESSSTISSGTPEKTRSGSLAFENSALFLKRKTMGEIQKKSCEIKTIHDNGEQKV